MNWIEAIFSRLAELWPCSRVESGNHAVFYKLGVARRVVPPGIHCAWWWFNQIRIEPTAIDTLDLATQSDTTSDGVELSYDVRIIYAVVNPLKKQTKVREFADSLSDLTAIFLGRAVRDSTYEWLRDNRGLLEVQLRRLMSKYARAWGVKIYEVGFTNFVRAPLVRHMGDVMLHMS